MATQIVDFSTINDVIKDGLSLDEIILDATTIWSRPPSGDPVDWVWTLERTIDEGDTFPALTGSVHFKITQNDAIDISQDGLVLLFDSSDSLLLTVPQVFRRGSATNFLDSAWTEAFFTGSTAATNQSAMSPNGDHIIRSSSGTHRTYSWDGSSYAYTGSISQPATDGGVAMSDDGNMAVIADANSDVVKTYELIGGAWLLSGTITGAAGSDFGASICLVQGTRSHPSSLYGARVAIGAPEHTGGGRVRVYDTTASGLVQVGSDIVPPTEILLGFGNHVELSNDGLVLAVSSPKGTSGGVVTYRYISSDWVETPVPFAYSYRGCNSASLNQDGTVLAIDRRRASTPRTETVAFVRDGATWSECGNPFSVTTSSAGNSPKLNGAGDVMVNGFHDILLNEGAVLIQSRQATYTLSAPSVLGAEGTALDITLTTTNLEDTSVNYTITGISAGDISEPLTGSFSVVSNTATETFNFTADVTTEGTETMTLTLDNGGDSINITIIDTST